jgi:hypothetical protein
MANVSTTDILSVPQPTKESGQRSMRVSDAYFARMVPGWSQPSALTPGQWRAWVAAQPVAVTCKETMTSNISDLDWKITPRKSDMRDELKGDINHYEKFFRRAGESGLDWIGFLEWFISDLNDLPFGTAWEIGRKGDQPDGRAIWMEPLDGGTLYPTNNKDIPVIQYYNNFYANFPAHAIARAYMNPRPEIERKGWGIAPPEKIFLAMEMLARGDRYYANLLLDVPPVGVFDMADITWEDAHTWIESFRTFTQGGVMDGFRIPVLAEHQKDVKFIPLGKDPNAIMYDIITLKYASLVCAAYGMTTSDIGLQGSSGETLAGSIRGEQKTNRTGKARNKGKIKYFIETILPPALQFDFIDTDGERLAMLGRARLANATAMNQFREMESISPEEARLQMIQDGIFTISMTEKPPKEAKMPIQTAGAFGNNGKSKPSERPGSVGSPQAPSLGGDGEVKKGIASFQPQNLDQAITNIVSIVAPSVYESMGDEPEQMKSLVLESVFSVDDSLGLGSVLSGMVNRIGTFEFNGLEEELESLLAEEGISVNTENHIDILKSRIQEGFSEFIGKAIVYTLTQSELLENPKNVDGYADFTDLAEEVKSKINKSMNEYLSAHIGIEIQNIMEEIRTQQLEIPEPIRIRSLPRQIKAQPISVIVNPSNIALPDITVNIPERASHVNVESPNVDIQPAQITVESPTINVSVPEKEVNIQVDVPKQDAPIVNLSQPSIQVNVPAQQAPIVNVEVSPTPVNIENTVHLPEQKPVKREITIIKDSENTWHGEANAEEE